MDILDVFGFGHDQVRGGLGRGILQLLELYECHEPVSRLAALLVIVVGVLNISLDGDDTVRS
jgi:hypothetical protein